MHVKMHIIFNILGDIYYYYYIIGDFHVTLDIID